MNSVELLFQFDLHPEPLTHLSVQGFQMSHLDVMSHVIVMVEIPCNRFPWNMSRFYLLIMSTVAFILPPNWGQLRNKRKRLTDWTKCVVVQVTLVANVGERMEGAYLDPSEAGTHPTYIVGGRPGVLWPRQPNSDSSSLCAGFSSFRLTVIHIHTN